MEFDELSCKVIGCAIDVHRELGPGLLESTYSQCLSYELREQGIVHSTEHPVPVRYKGVEVGCGYRAEMVVEDALILELKSVQDLSAVHEAQLLAYMRLARIRTGLLINFNVTMLKNGIRRFVL